MRPAAGFRRRRRLPIAVRWAPPKAPFFAMRECAMAIDIADPRIRAASVAAVHAPLLNLAQARLAAATEASGEEIDRALAQRVAEQLQSGQASRLAEAIAAAPSVEVARQLWRGLIDGWALASRAAAGETVTARLFALPVVVVAACEEGGALSAPTPSIAGVLPDAARLAAILREHRALGGTQTFALANALVAAAAIEVPQLSTLLAWQTLAAGTDFSERDLPPTAIAVQPGQQTVHLRFLIGSALVAGEGDVPAAESIGWAMPLARELARALATPGLAVLALPRPAQSPPAALQQGLAAQREVGAQLFASNAIRKLRAATGEPAAVISAHRAAGATGGGELRLSLSSPFDPRAAEGFRCPLFATDRASDVAAMLVETLRDCRIADVRVLPGVHPDRDPETGTAVLFKADALDAVERGSLH
jgi:hypothetical protein